MKTTESFRSILFSVLGMFDGNPSFQRIVRLGLLAELEEGNQEIFHIEDWSNDPTNPEEYPRRSDRSGDVLRSFTGNHTRPTSSVYPVPYFTTSADLPHPPSVKDKESDTERRGTLLQEAKKYKGKADRKRLKKQKQKEKRRLEKMEKEKQNPAKNDDEESKQVNNGFNSTDKQLASAKDTDSSDSSDEASSDDDGDSEIDSGAIEELDMSSLFVSKAADIARRKLEQNPKLDKKEKKSPLKEEPKTSPKKPNEKPTAEEDCVASSSLTVEDNRKISTDLANTGNRFASAGDFNTAVKYFTDAIKFNPTEFKLFGNRSLCFEKMHEYEKALTDAELSLSMCPGWVKGLFRKGRALAGLKRYKEASRAFREVLSLDGSCAEAAQELMRVQITQLMEYGFTREQSSNALIIHGTVQKALEVLSQLNNQPGPVQNAALSAASVSRVSPVLSASSPALHPLQSQNAPVQHKPLVPIQNMPNVQSQPKPDPYQGMNANHNDRRQPQELFPIWVGNLFHPVTESDIKHLFNKAGVVYSVKLLSFKRCAFVNYTKQEYCDEAIRRFHGFDLNGAKIAVRYPDRIPQGMGISRNALRSDDLQDEDMRYEYNNGWYPAGSRRPFRPFRGNDY
uniref:tetratricopeptide repeat protein 31-like isoform X2 n=1 Tax=Semicossyphus pulcher TaxID=241346 RepID=UPI0037E8B1CF